MSEENHSNVLLHRFRQGDEQAAQELFDAYVDRLIRLAQSRLSPLLSKRVDAEDVVQSAYRSFFVGARAGRFNASQSGDLWRLLAAITINKVYRQVERHVTASLRSVRAEVEVSSGVLDPQSLAREPSPEQVLMATEELQSILEQFRPDRRKIIQMKLQGHSLHEIADACECSERTVRRVLDKVKEILEQRTVDSSVYDTNATSP